MHPPGQSYGTSQDVLPSTYPCQLISNNAMTNHSGIEGVAIRKIAGPARIIIAERVSSAGGWSFRVDTAGADGPIGCAVVVGGGGMAAGV